MIEFTPNVATKASRNWESPTPNPSWHKDPTLAPSLEFSKKQTQQFAKSFYFCSHLLAPAEKHASYVVYAFCRYIDDIIDEASEPLEDGLTFLQAELSHLYAGTSTLLFAPAFQVVIEEYKIPRYLLDELIYGCCLDQSPQRLQTYEELEEYCYYVASVVGLMMSKIFGLKSSKGVPYAISMGIAMQLTNILRDIQEDAQMGRRYLPADELTQYGLSTDNLSSAKDSSEWKAFMSFQIKRARSFYELADEGVVFLKEGPPQLTTKAMAKVYGGILEEIEKENYNIFDRRASTSLGKKIGLLLLAILN